MASSSLNNGLNNLNPGEDDEDWLELGLGLGAQPKQATGLSSGSSRLGLGLGLGCGGLGFGDNDDDVVRNAPLNFNHHYYPGMGHHASSSASLPSPSPMMPWHMDFSGLFHRERTEAGNGLAVSRSVLYGHRPETGLWFSLRTSDCRGGEALPQIPKAYIRVKDENVTIFVVKKYLVRKLGLVNEAEIDISCMGQKLLHSHTLKYVQDFIWLPAVIEPFNATKMIGSAHPSVDHLMSLHYGRHCFWD
ncbi:protein LAX PANICLE 2-like isoform X2 [Tasmannia lanceolata]|uniref:protein LAX PANICLE 2-like isoform X2 n=1 Tax=Tasmannia lanceolata TaxID=3420 RepID=UPI004062EBEE